MLGGYKAKKKIFILKKTEPLFALQEKSYLVLISLKWPIVFQLNSNEVGWYKQQNQLDQSDELFITVT